MHLPLASHKENTCFIILICAVATIGGFLFGFDSGVINGTVDRLQQAFGSSKAGLGFEVASMLLGCALGAFFAGAAGRFVGTARGAHYRGGAVPLLGHRRVSVDRGLDRQDRVQAVVVGGFARNERDLGVGDLAFAALSIIFVLKYVQETKGRELEQMEG